MRQGHSGQAPVSFHMYTSHISCSQHCSKGCTLYVLADLVSQTHQLICETLQRMRKPMLTIHYTKIQFGAVMGLSMNHTSITVNVHMITTKEICLGGGRVVFYVSSHG